MHINKLPLRRFPDHRPRVTSASKNRIESKRSYQLKFADEVNGAKLHFPTSIRSDMGLTMGEAQMIAQDRHRWRRDIVALCPTLG